MPLDTILLLDTSGSMAGSGMRELKRACHTFLNGVEETAAATGLRENVAIVEFNSTARVVQSLSDNYSRCRRAVDSLKATGRTAMFDGLMDALKEIMLHGGVLRIAGLAMTPRIILMTDGKPNDSAGDEEAKKKVIAAALGFGPGWQECGLPHPVPIACVGCGDCDTALLQIIAKITKGMYVIVSNISELSTFFRRQVLLIRFVVKFAADMERLRSQLALAAFLQELGEAVEEAEVEAMQRLLLAMLQLAVTDDDDDDDGPPRPAAASGGASSQPRLAITSGPSNPSRSPGPSSVPRAPSHPVTTGSSSRPGATGGTTLPTSRPAAAPTRSSGTSVVQRTIVVATTRPTPPAAQRPSTTAVVPARPSGRSSSSRSGSCCSIL